MFCSVVTLAVDWAVNIKNLHFDLKNHIIHNSSNVFSLRPSGLIQFTMDKVSSNRNWLIHVSSADKNLK